MSRRGVPAPQAARLAATEDRWLEVSEERLRRRRVERAAARRDQRLQGGTGRRAGTSS